MIDYDKPDDDPVVAEVRRAREELAAEFHFDLHAIFKEMRRRQALEPHKYAVPSVQTASSKPRKRAV